MTHTSPPIDATSSTTLAERAGPDAGTGSGTGEENRGELETCVRHRRAPDDVLTAHTVPFPQATTATASPRVPCTNAGVAKTVASRRRAHSMVEERGAEGDDTATV